MNGNYNIVQLCVLAIWFVATQNMTDTGLKSILINARQEILNYVGPIFV